MTRPILIASTMITMLFAVMALGQQPAANDQPPPVTTLLYDTRGLLQPARNYPSSVLGAVTERVGVSPGPNVFGPNPEPPQPAGQERVDALIKLIEETVDNDTWKDNGGATGAIREFGGNLVITQTAETHAKIRDLLAKLPDQQARLVRVRIDWIVADPNQVRLDVAGEGSAGALRQVDRAALQKLPAEALRAAAETTCFTGQTVSLSSGRIQSYVSDLNPIVAQDAAEFDPSVNTFRAGAELQVTPTIQTDGKSAVVDLHSVVSDWDESTPYEFHGATLGPTTQSAGAPAKPGAVNQIQRPRPMIQQLHTTLRVPLGKPIIVGGMTLEPSASRVGDRSQLMLVVEVSGG